MKYHPTRIPPYDFLNVNAASHDSSLFEVIRILLCIVDFLCQPGTGRGYLICILTTLY